MISSLTPNNSQNNILTPGDSTPARFGDVNRVIRDVNTQLTSSVSYISNTSITQNNLQIFVYKGSYN